jgi:hypothetical protein
MSNETQAKRRGRPQGSNSFVKLRLEDLIAIVGTGAVVPISKVWLRDQNISIGAAVVPVAIAPAPEPVAEEEKISFSLTSFDDEDGGEKDEE